MHHRLARLRERLAADKLDGMLISAAPNRRYLSGFSGSAGTLLVTAERALLLSDFRYQTQAAQEAPDWEFRLLTTTAPLPKQLPALLRELGLHRLGFEAAHVSVAEFEAWRTALDEAQLEVTWQPTQGLVETLRQVKDEAEIATLRRAIAITDAAFAAVRPRLRPEMREREVAWELEKALRERGAEGIAFEIIVAAGPNGAQPHARPGDEPLGVGRPIVIDFGARVAGYHADMTRTVILGEADERFWTIYNTVLAAQRAAAEGIRPGMTGREADALARDVISAAGYGACFGHSLGHGVGLEIHEGPRLSQASDDQLPVGAVFSIEPGIYLPDWGGVRIEDLTLLTEQGPLTLTQSDKQPLIEL
ncbi:aminopeptidase P family protein [Kallotenue papyrolyticum]|uniref:aminopeptidase P family protein n=1 Tax=Kallotenue papyrolyticum TaxID=1325125 RepID=UPI000492CFF4|nr:aminopeptidase P family protein [Kallotenue papyrolyticum]